MTFEKFITWIGNFAWGPYMIILLVGTGIYLTFKLMFIQIRGFKHAVELITGKYDKNEDEGEITHFQALCTALSATIGTGNIAGVATAIASGGPGAVFWMWITAFFGMATKFTSCTLSLLYRKLNPDNTVSGGPMYYLEKGLKQKWLGILFAFFALIASFGIGNMVQANSVVSGVFDIFPESVTSFTVFNIPLLKIIFGFTLAVLVGLVIIGGVKRIAKVASFIVPFMAAGYVLGALWVILLNITKIPGLLVLIVKSAFTPHAAIGGFAGATVKEVIRFGVARGVFSNESGLGSAPMAHAAAKTKYPVREGLVAMLGPFIDTILICSMTAFVILLSQAWTLSVNGSQLTGAALSRVAFNKCLHGIGGFIVSFGLIFFAFSTMISWSYYGDRCAQYLFGNKAVKLYRWLYVIFIVIGATTKLELVWSISDAMNGLMAIPNLIGLIFLSNIVVKQTKKYLKNHKINKI